MENIRGARLRKFNLRKIILGVRMHFRHTCLSVVSFNIPTARFFLLPVTAASYLLVHKILLGLWLDAEQISKIPLFVLTQLTNVTDTQTDRQTDRHCMTA